MRPGYTPLPRPHDPRRKAPMPTVPPALPREVGGALVRAAHRLGLTVADADRALSVEDIFDEMDSAAYLHDVDHEPATEPQPSVPTGRR
jgi:hypothetical protein